ncbi:MAG: HAMP domain-containing protein [Magnetococcales bacterium]|nr:HAMP domain-containing protein [Magnetococcales bacterium]
MIHLNRLQISHRITAGVTIPLILLIVVGVWSWTASHRVLGEVGQIRNERLTRVLMAQRLGKELLKMQYYLTEVSINKAEKGGTDPFIGAEEYFNSIVKNLKEYKAAYQNDHNEKNLQAVDEILAKIENFYNIGKKMTLAFIANNKEEGFRLKHAFDEEAEYIDYYFVPLMTQEEETILEEMTGLEKSMSNLKRGLVVVMLLALTCSGLVGWLIVRSLVKPISLIASAMRIVAGGELGGRVPVIGRDELSEITTIFNDMLDNLARNAMVTMVQSGNVNAIIHEQAHLNETLNRHSLENMQLARRVVSENDQLDAKVHRLQESITQANDNLTRISGSIDHLLEENVQPIAAKALSASRNVEGMAAASRSMNAHINEVYDNLQRVDGSVRNVGREVGELSNGIAEVRRQCRDASAGSNNATLHTKQSLEVMGNLTEEVRAIADIVEMINEIADQTKMLALNASIEAAGAGEAGKGFAVVANEVKELAHQTAKATLNISELAVGIRARVDEVSEATHQLDAMIGGIARINDAIEVSMDEQSLSVETIMENMRRVEHATGDVKAHAERLLEASSEVAQTASNAEHLTVSIAEDADAAARAVAFVADNSREASSQAESVRLFAGDIYAASIQVQRHMLVSMNLTSLVRGLIEFSGLLTRYGQTVGDSLEESGRALRTGRQPLTLTEIKSSHLRVVESVRLALCGATPESAAPLTESPACPLRDTPLHAHPEVSLADRRFHEQVATCLAALQESVRAGLSPETHDSAVQEMETNLIALFTALDKAIANAS